MLQQYTSGVYQPVTPSTYRNICLVHPSLDISESLFSSSEILTSELLLPLSGTPMNIKFFDDPIFSIPYISQVSSSCCWPVSYEHPPKYLHGIQRQWGAFICLNCCRNALGQTKMHYILLCNTHPWPETSIHTHLPWGTLILLWPSPPPLIVYH